MKLLTIPPEQGNFYTHALFEKIFTPEECEFIIKLEGRIVPSTIFDNQNKPLYDEAKRYSKAKAIEYNEKTAWIFDRLSRAVLQANKTYFNFNISNLQEVHVIQYDVNDFFASHWDMGNGPSSTRKLSIVSMLSKRSDYDGGNLKWNPPQENFKQEQGNMAIFPSFITHEVEPVTRGVRYALVSWVHGPRFK